MNKRIYCVLVALILLSPTMATTADVMETTDVIEKTVDVPEQIVEEVTETPTEVEKQISLGVCKVTAYCKENYPHICNNGDSSKTATGTIPTSGRTVAVDPTIIPYGSKVIINGHTYIAEDCGGAIKGNRVDICFNTHQEALDFGIQYLEVSYVIREDK